MTISSMTKLNRRLFVKKLESIQYKAALAIMGAIQSKKVYEELGLKSLKSRRWCKRLSSMFKIMKGKAPNYLKNLIQINQSVRTNKNKPCTNIPL